MTSPKASTSITQPRDRLTLYCDVQVLFLKLSRYDLRFGFNGYYKNLQGDQFPDPAIFEGWQHPAIVEYMACRSIEDKQFLEDFHLEEIEWNIRRLLKRYKQTACVRPLMAPYQKRGFEPKEEPYAA